MKRFFVTFLFSLVIFVVLLAVGCGLLYMFMPQGPFHVGTEIMGIPERCLEISKKIVSGGMMCVNSIDELVKNRTLSSDDATFLKTSGATLCPFSTSNRLDEVLFRIPCSEGSLSFYESGRTELRGPGKTLTNQNVTFFLSIINLLFVSISVSLVYSQIRTTHEWNRMRAAHDLIFESNLGKFREWRNALERNIDIYNPRETFDDKKSTFTKDDYLTLDSILNFMEGICVAIGNHVVDEDIVYEYLSAIVIAYARWAKAYIRDNRQADPTFWIEIDGFVEKWTAKECKIKAKINKKRLKKPPL